jgi:hypothetical protein
MLKKWRKKKESVGRVGVNNKIIINKTHPSG